MPSSVLRTVSLWPVSHVRVVCHCTMGRPLPRRSHDLEVYAVARSLPYRHKTSACAVARGLPYRRQACGPGLVQAVASLGLPYRHETNHEDGSVADCGSRAFDCGSGAFAAGVVATAAVVVAATAAVVVATAGKNWSHPAVTGHPKKAVPVAGCLSRYAPASTAPAMSAEPLVPAAVAAPAVLAARSPL